MHFIIGGAHNGKRKWVSEQLLKGESFTDIHRPGEKWTGDSIVFTHLENWVSDQFGQRDSDQVVADWKLEIERLLEWENGKPERRVIVIGEDQSKGIVPIDESQRFTRDVLGWCHQFTALKAERVTRIWYGISEDLKTREDIET
ncbi:bifunctional adenosylcobinamide kinase/adenosylcobinamide-phosphate guanylyltransferase [Jeotgalibacillus sp. R-1-5s-1]|uniref:bifunctional adenosylcobinamide kinase/adenosylcobinamide-phosphate guanylyltransferase n=1 Tax=Jeotgalibacillus sp. R-1-5s-1 TaxID=2555897 RepID=UPI00106AD717|nr:bifunctional adenosylcobinamide kinase/adenosylcobinamide-phosphate guanylyltransferase [Jeotgalibacillus sp. R-1-5s-1]TFD92929.1 hypothetical protein E2491_15330 [Jeotgalibacillus sp. R-1-5s-1]